MKNNFEKLFVKACEFGKTIFVEVNTMETVSLLGADLLEIAEWKTHSPNLRITNVDTSKILIHS